MSSITKGLVSIVLNSYNGEKYISQQIDSILHQTYSNFELIIWDDASTDRTVEIVRQYKNKDHRIRLYTHRHNRGLMKSYTLALRHIKGQYITLADNDNAWCPNRLQLLIDYLFTHPRISLVYSDCYVCDQHLNVINNSLLGNIQSHRFSINYTDINNHSFNKFLDVNHIPGVSVMFDLRLLPYARKNPPTIIHDHWLALIASSLFKIGYINQSLVYYRLHPKNLVGLNSNNYFSFIKNINNPSFSEKYVNDKQNYMHALLSLSKLIKSPINKKQLNLKIAELLLFISLATSDTIPHLVTNFSLSLKSHLVNHRYSQIKYATFLSFQRLISLL